MIPSGADFRLQLFQAEGARGHDRDTVNGNAPAEMMPVSIHNLRVRQGRVSRTPLPMCGKSPTFFVDV